MNGFRIIKTIVIFYLCFISLIAANAMGEVSKEKLLAQIAEAHRKIHNIHVIFSNRSEEKVNTYEWAKEGEKEYRKKRYGVNFDVPEGEEERWGKCMWDGKLLRHYGSAADNGAIRTKYDPYTSPSVTWNSYCRHFGTLMGDTVLSLIEKLSAEDWDVKYDEKKKIVILSTDDVMMKNSGMSHHWHIDLNKGCMISRYRVEFKTKEGSKTVSDMTVLEWKNMGDGLWLPWKSKTISTLPGRPIRERLLTVASADVNDKSIGRFFAVFEWPRGCQYYDETLDATVIPHATEKNMQKALDHFTFEALSDIDSQLPITSKPDKTTTTKPSPQNSSSQSSLSSRNKMDRGFLSTTGRYWIFIVLGIIVLLLVSVWGWKRYGRNQNVST